MLPDSLVELDAVVVAQLPDCGLFLTEELQGYAIFGSVTLGSPFTLSVQGCSKVHAVSLPLESRYKLRDTPKR